MVCVEVRGQEGSAGSRRERQQACQPSTSSAVCFSVLGNTSLRVSCQRSWICQKTPTQRFCRTFGGPMAPYSVPGPDGYILLVSGALPAWTWELAVPQALSPSPTAPSALSWTPGEQHQQKLSPGSRHAQSRASSKCTRTQDMAVPEFSMQTGGSERQAAATKTHWAQTWLSSPTAPESTKLLSLHL